MEPQLSLVSLRVFSLRSVRAHTHTQHTEASQWDSPRSKHSRQSFPVWDTACSSETNHCQNNTVLKKEHHTPTTAASFSPRAAILAPMTARVNNQAEHNERNLTPVTLKDSDSISSGLSLEAHDNHNEWILV